MIRSRIWTFICKLAWEHIKNFKAQKDVKIPCLHQQVTQLQQTNLVIIINKMQEYEIMVLEWPLSSQLTDSPWLIILVLFNNTAMTLYHYVLTRLRITLLTYKMEKNLYKHKLKFMHMHFLNLLICHFINLQIHSVM